MVRHIAAAIALSFIGLLAGCATLPAQVPKAGGPVAARILVAARSRPRDALPAFSLGRVFRAPADAGVWARRLAVELEAADYAPIVEARPLEPDEAAVPFPETPEHVWTVALELDHLELDEQPGAWFWFNSALWITTWLPSAAVPDRVFEVRMRVACRVYRGEDAALDREFLSRAELTLNPVQYGQPWLGLVRFEFAPGGSLHRAALDADDWAGVSARLEPLLLADLSRRVAGVLTEAYRQPKEDAPGAQAP